METAILIRLDTEKKQAFEHALDGRTMSAFIRKQIDQLIERENKNEDRSRTRKTTD